MEEQIENAIDVAKAMVRVMSDDKELIDLTTSLTVKYLDSYIEKGFSREEAIQLVVALTGKNSN